MKSYFSLLLVILFMSCSNDDSNNKIETEADILQYISNHNLVTKKSNSGLYYVIQKQGEGAKPTSNSNVTVNYKGYFLNGKIFDQSSAAGISFNLQQVIKGWTEGLQLMSVGSKWKLYVPSELAYGERSAGPKIPGNSVLIFDLELLSIKGK